MRPQPDDNLKAGASPDEAHVYLIAHDERAKHVDQMGDRALKLLYNAALHLRGMTLMLGGALSHDELVNAIVDLEFPDASKAREIWYRHVQMPALGQD